MSDIYGERNPCAFRQFCEGRSDDISALRNQLRDAEAMAYKYKAYVHHWDDCSFHKDWGTCSCGLFALLSGAGREATMADWQPIETAPKKTRVIVASATEGDRQAIAHLYQIVEGGLWRWWSDNAPLHFAPTHWQPLPEPPSEGEQS